jgi:hypothetical protein
MAAFCTCTSGHWNALTERWNDSEWNRAFCGNPQCTAPLQPPLTYTPPPPFNMPVGRLADVHRCRMGHLNLSPKRLVRGVCGAPNCNEEFGPAPSQTPGAGAVLYRARDGGQAEALALAGQFLNTRERVRLTEVSSLLNRESRRHGYDPFGGNTSLGNPTNNNNANNNAVTLPLTLLAKHAFNHLYGVVKAKFGFGAQLKPGDLSLKHWSEKNSFNQSGSSSFLGSNCLARATIGGQPTNAVNFISPYGEQGRQRLIDALGLANQPAIPLSRYTSTTHKHGEVRLAEEQDNRYEREPISVDKLCCLFCAAQMEALGRTASVTGAAAGTLSWYTFTPYVMYFRDRREQMWGGEVERGFSRLSRENKIQFLRILADLAKNHPFNTSQQSPVYTGLPTIADVIQGLP